MVLVVAGAVVVRGPLAAVVLFVLGADFAVRAFGQPRHSPLAAVARGMVHALKMRPQPVDAAPKRFAAKIGLVFSLSASVLFLAQVPVGAIAVAAILGFCALLESAFGVCIGCKVYAALPRRT